MAKRLKKVNGCRNLYADALGFYWARSQRDGKDDFVALGTTRKAEALDLQEKLNVKKFKTAYDIEDTPASKKPSPFLGGVLDNYREAAYPDMRMKPRDKSTRYYQDQE